MYECKLLCDMYRVDIINRLLDEDDNVITLKWKLRRLENNTGNLRLHYHTLSQILLNFYFNIEIDIKI